MKLIYFLLLISCTSCILANDSIIATVIEVHDGDTFYINIQDVHPVFGKRLPVRVNGIDTPELHSTSTDEKIKAEHAKSVAKSKLYNKQVELYNIKRDKYFRLNADVKILSTGEDFAKFMLDKKLAKPYDGGTKPVWKSNEPRKIRFLDFLLRSDNMDKLPPITQFSGLYRWLSNFWPIQIEYEGKIYPSVEHAYQAAKTLDNGDREAIRIEPNPAAAKKLGNKVQLREDWEDIKLKVMRKLLKQKFSKDPWMSMLIATADRKLIEGNWWNDTYWGVCKGKGENRLGKLLMAIRKNLIKKEPME